MKLDQRLQKLEARQPSTKRIVRAIQDIGETEETAIDRACREAGIQERNDVYIILRAIVAPPVPSHLH